jgi:hypothetical protein
MDTRNAETEAENCAHICSCTAEDPSNESFDASSSRTRERVSLIAVTSCAAAVQPELVNGHRNHEDPGNSFHALPHLLDQ